MLDVNCHSRCTSGPAVLLLYIGSTIACHIRCSIQCRPTRVWCYWRRSCRCSISSISWCLCCCHITACAAVVSAGDEPNVGTGTTPGMSCAVARCCCCSSKMLGQIANSNTAPILKIMPKEALDIISQYRECQLYK